MGKAQTGRNSRIQPNNFSECGRKSVKSEAALGIVVLVVAMSDFFVVPIDLFLGFFVSLLWVFILYRFPCVQLLLKTETAATLVAV